MQPNQFWILLAKKNNHEASEKDLRELEALMSQQRKDEVSVELMEEILENLESTSVEEIKEIRAKNWPIIQGFLDQDKSTNNQLSYSGSKSRIFWSSAAAAGIFIFSFLFYANYDKWFLKDTVNIEVAKGGLQKLILPDGTCVWLNSDSKIEYDRDFGVVNREVKLTGEAYFEVVKNAKKPFFVNTGKIQIKVLGTKFNVKSYEDSKTEASLIEGKIELKVLSDPDRTYILKPKDKVILTNVPTSKKNEDAVASKTTLVFSNIKVSDNDPTPIEIIWTKNRIVFDSENFETLLRQLERHYDVTINLNDNNMSVWKFSGSFDSETIEEVLYALKVAHPFRYTIKDKVINIDKP